MTGRQKKALAALLTAPTMREAAERSGTSYPTLRRWLKTDPDFRSAYRDELSGILEGAALQSRKGLQESVFLLRSIIRDTSINPAVRVTAARALLDSSMKLIEVTDLIARIEALERGENS